MPHVYILSNKRKTVLYIGSTVDIVMRMKQHISKYYKNSFTAKYNVDILVYVEEYEHLYEARSREYQLKQVSRKKKEKLIGKENPNWENLYPSKLMHVLKIWHLNQR